MGGLGMGTIDILWAIGNSAIAGKGPIWTFQTIAGGILHRATYDGGLASAFLGMFLHYFIATSWVTLFYLLSRKFPVLVQRPLIAGPIYGLGVYFFMYDIVLPLAQWGGGFHPGIGMAKAIFIHLFGVGLVTSLVVSKGPAPVRHPS
jgi:hypothetical protein